MVTFLLNGEVVNAEVKSSDTLLNFLRDVKELAGTKEGCNEGDCGACSVIVTDTTGKAKTTNSCITLMPQIHGKAVRTVEGISGPDGSLHPIQKSIVKNHGSQCGFCTPGFISTLAAAHKNGESDFENQLAGNLCRCTGYGPIIQSAKDTLGQPVPVWMNENLEKLKDITFPNNVPQSIEDLATLYKDNPEATLVAGATDLSLDITKKLKSFQNIIFLGGCEKLKRIDITKDTIEIGAACTISELIVSLSSTFPSFTDMLLRYGAVQIRNSATIGGNIANGSPVGDGSPALIAIGAILKLRHAKTIRMLPIEEFFIDYGVQDLNPGEFIESILVPRDVGILKCYKVSKRFDQDISAVCGCFKLTVVENTVTECRISYGGMAAVPKRAFRTEKKLIGSQWSLRTFETAKSEISKDFYPISDLRASSNYRLKVAQNLLIRLFYENSDVKVDSRKVVSCP